MLIHWLFELPVLIGFWEFWRVALTIMGIGGVIFFHELGHFMVARWNGVRTEAFSLGFPPNGLRIRRYEDGIHVWIIGRETSLFSLPWFKSTTDATEYRIGLLPLGGYVKMAGEGIGEGTGATDELRSKSVAARGAIFSAGVIMNVIFAVVAFTIAFQVGVNLTAPVIGEVTPASAAANSGLLPGDRVLTIDGEGISTFEDIAGAVAFADAALGMTIELERNGTPMTIAGVIPSYNKHVGRQQLGVAPAGTTRLNTVDTAAAAAGVKPGDRVVSLNGTPVRYQHELVNLFGDLARKQTPSYTFVLERDGDGTAAPEQFTAVFDLSKVREGGWAIGASIQRGWRLTTIPPGSPLLSHGLQAGDLIIGIGDDHLGSYAAKGREVLSDGNGNPKPWPQWLESYGGATAEIEVYRGAARLELSVPLAPEEWAGTTVEWAIRALPQRGSPADAAGVQSGDDVVAIAGTPVTRYAQMVELINAHPGKPLSLELRDAAGGTRTVTMTTWVQSPASFGFVGYDFAKDLVQVGPIKGLAMGWDASLKFGKQVINTISSVAQRKVSAEKNLGGPLTIVSTTFRITKLGFGMTLYFLAILSVNLAILNVLPIPVLDGGHLFFLAIEAVRRRPVSDNIQIAAQYVGLLLLLALMVYVTINDIGRF